MPYNSDTPGMSYALSELGVKGNPDLPVVDASRVLGGAWSVASAAYRDLIPATLRKADVTTCYVQGDNKTYVLRGGIDNANWQPVFTNGTNGLDASQLVKLMGDQSATTGQPFSMQVALDLFGSNYDVVAVSNLPPGLQITLPQTIAGTPTTAGRYVVIIDFHNPLTNKLIQYVFLIVVGDGGATSTLALDSFLGIFVQCKQGQAFSFPVPQNLFRSSGGHAVSIFSVDGLPDGLSYDATGHTLFGTSTETGRFVVVLQATDNYGGNAQYVFSLWVHPAGTTTPAPPTSTPATTVGAANIDLVYNPIADDAGNPNAVIHYDYDLALQLTESDLAEVNQRAVPGSADARYIGQKAIDKAIALAALGGSIGSTTQQRFYRFAISLAVLRTLYPNKTTVGFAIYGKRKGTNPTDTANNKISAVTINRTKTSGIIPKTAGNNVDFTTNGDALAPVTTSTGWPVGASESLLFSLTVNLSTGELTIGTATPTANQSPYVSNHAGNTTGTVGMAFSYPLPTSEFTDSDGSIVSRSATSLPPGLSYNAGTNTISGTPTQAGTYTVTITATDNQGAGVNDTFTITLASQTPNQSPVVSNHVANQTATVGTAYGQTLPANEFSDPDGSIANIAVTNLPDGLSFNLASRQINGTPTTAGTYTVNVTATDNGGATVVDSFTITVASSAGSTTYSRDGQDYYA